MLGEVIGKRVEEDSKKGVVGGSTRKTNLDGEEDEDEGDT
jgi:hypothetical protein